MRASRGSATHSTRPSTNRTTASSTGGKPRARPLPFIPGIDVPILAFTARSAVRAVGADVVIAVAPRAHVHVRVPPRVFRQAVQVAVLPVILRDPAGVGELDQRLDPLVGGGVEPVVQLEQPERLLDVLDLDPRL